MKRFSTFVLVLMMALSGHAIENIVHLESLMDGDYRVQNNDVLTGTLGHIVHIYVPNNVKFTLRDAIILGIDKEDYTWAGITIQGDATMIVEGNNFVKGFYKPFPGIHVFQNATLTIKGSGRLNAYGAGDSPGIGGGHGYKYYTDWNHDHWIDYDLDCGNIYIEGGEIYAQGTGESPGIGTDPYEWCGSIHITSGVTKVTAVRGEKCDYCVGGTGLRTGMGYDLTIGGKTYPPSNSYGPCVAPNDGGNSFVYIPWKGSLASLTDDAEVKDGSTIQGILDGKTKKYKITIPDGAHIKLNGAQIKGYSWTDCPWAGLNCNGDATIELVGDYLNYVEGFGKGWPGIYVPAGKTLTIIGEGNLKAVGGQWGAGIGSGSAADCGNIVIKGGYVTAESTCDYAAAIGSGYKTNCGNITIEPTVEAVVMKSCDSSPCVAGAGWGGNRGILKIGDKNYGQYGCVEGPTYTYYGSPEGVELVSDPSSSSRKIIREGQLIIIRNGVEYNANGQIIK